MNYPALPDDSDIVIDRDYFDDMCDATDEQIDAAITNLKRTLEERYPNCSTTVMSLSNLGTMRAAEPYNHYVAEDIISDEDYNNSWD